MVDMKRLLFLSLLLTVFVSSRAQINLDSIQSLLLNSPVQEKVYLHLDNMCYYKGDTIWYKAYVVRADSLTYTDMSRILYVELVSPDGMVVERQQIIISDRGYSDGNFALKDSIYSGYYELRAYTRWMLNFKVTTHDYGYKDREYFYNKQMAADFFRQFGTIYSRVVPVYERPEEEGDYAMKYIVSRPKTRVDKELKEKLTVNFYPEGGHLIANTRCHVAFEALNEDGEQVDIQGAIGNLIIKTEHQGRGSFVVDVPESGRLTADFHYKGKDYHIDLPKTERRGCALTLTDGQQELTAHITIGSYLPSLDYGVAVLCRGVLKVFEKLTPDDKGQTVIKIDKSKLPTGVNNLIVFDEMGQPLADRLFFVNHHDYDAQTITVTSLTDSVMKADKTYEPYEQIQLCFKAPVEARHISIAVRDAATDEPTYDTGNMLTDLLLSSELKGFVAYPHYYFEADDEQHRRALDLLMLVQGWRRYDFQDITAHKPLRYKPETAMTIEGSVYPTAEEQPFEPDEVSYWARGIFGYSPSMLEAEGSFSNTEDNDVSNVSQRVRSRIEEGKHTLDDSRDEITLEEIGTAVYIQKDDGATSVADPFFGINHGGLSHEVTVRGELVFEDDIATIEMETENGGHFAFSMPPYYGQAILFLKAYKTDISEKKRKRIDNKGALDETEWPEFYVKRDLFYPVFAKKYSFYQCHQPDEMLLTDSLDAALADSLRKEGVLSSFDRELQEVTVKQKRRRGRRAIDYSKPACVYDTQELYNLVTDRGLSFGRYSPRYFPLQVSIALLGNYNSDRALQVQARLNDRESLPYVYFRNYSPSPTIAEQFRSNQWINDNIKLNRQDEIRFYTDFELRNEDKRIEQQSTVADVTLDYMLAPNGATYYTFRDRRIILNGMTEPAMFYHRDYSQKPLPDTVKDYRRTLYWNANAKLDEKGVFMAIFYNNGKQTRIKIDAAGLTSNGMPLILK